MKSRLAFIPLLLPGGWFLHHRRPHRHSPRHAPAFYALTTAYCPCGGINGGGVTACGTRVYWGEVAADLRYWRCGERLYIRGYGKATVEDSGGAIIGPHRFDLGMPTYSEAIDWGVRTVRAWKTR